LSDKIGGQREAENGSEDGGIRKIKSDSTPTINTGGKPRKFRKRLKSRATLCKEKS